MYGGSSMLRNFRRGFFLDGGNDNLKTLSACGIENEKREAPVTSNQAEASGGRGHWGKV